MKNQSRVLSLSQFRTYLKCPRLFSYGGEVKAVPEIEIIEAIFERISSLYLKNEHYDLNSLYNDSVVILNRYSKKEQLLQSQYNKLLNTVIVFTSEIFKHFNIFQMYPIYGPILLNQKISKSVVKLKSSGVFRGVNQTIHLVVFSPYKNRLNVLNDPTVHFLNEAFRDFVKAHKTNRPKVIINIFYYKNDKELGHIKWVPPKNTRNYDSVLIGYENNSFNPIVPCNYSCKYKTKCEKNNYDI